jgi:aspartyl/asparaginyl beta-hydroxylase (cupin superfamily)
MIAILIPSVLLIALLITWLYEPRIFVFLSQRFLYKTDQRAVFPENIDHYFPQYKMVEENIHLLQSDLDGLLVMQKHIPRLHQLDDRNNKISFDKGPGWRTCYIKAFNGWFPGNCVRCPETVRLFSKMDNVVTVMFSIMEAGNKIPPHTGKFKGVLRYQLPLMVPSSGNCTITVGGITKPYQKGHSILFDDTIEHSVINDSPQLRVILFLDIEKKTNFLVRAVDRLFMKLVVISPKFKRSLIKSFQ